MNDVLSTIDKNIAAAEQQLAAWRSARESVVAALGGAGTVSEAHVARVPRRTKKAAPQKRVGKTVKQSAASTADGDSVLLQKTLAFLQKQTAPVKVSAVASALKVSPYRAKKAAELLVKRQDAVITGKTSGMRVGVPNVMAADAAKEEP